jgi:tRNA A37 N6-isopentenylltransferase MiaA
LVGGTGLYIKGVIEGIPTAEIPKNNRLRKSLETKL